MSSLYYDMGVVVLPIDEEERTFYEQQRKLCELLLYFGYMIQCYPSSYKGQNYKLLFLSMDETRIKELGREMGVHVPVEASELLALESLFDSTGKNEGFEHTEHLSLLQIFLHEEAKQVNSSPMMNLRDVFKMKWNDWSPMPMMPTTTSGSLASSYSASTSATSMWSFSSSQVEYPIYLNYCNQQSAQSLF